MDDTKKEITEEDIKAEFKELMICLKSERNKNFPIKGKELAEKLSKTINYVSAVENGNEFPSMKLFLNYLMLCGFDITPMKSLKIRKDNEGGPTILASRRVELMDKILGLNEGQLDFLLEQVKISEVFRLNGKKS